MDMPGRGYFTSSNANYRYGFNGKEKDKESPVQYDYGFRIYDPRLARFKSVDPITKKYPELTPYQFASNSPIENIDLDGLEKYSIHYKIENGYNIITKIATDYSIKYMSIDVSGMPIKPKIVEFLLENKDGALINKSGDIPLKNYGSTLYVGPINPKYESGVKKGQYSYEFPAINLLDLAGKHHDQGYDNKFAEGALDAVYLLRTLKLDKQLVKDAQTVVDLYNNNKIDPITKQKVSEETATAAKGVVSIFSKIVTEKTIRLALINAANTVVDKTKEVIDKVKGTVNDFSRDLNNLVPVPH